MKRKKYRNLVALVYESVWAITPERFEQMAEVLDLRLAGVTLSEQQIEQRIAAARSASYGAPALQPPPSRVALLNLSGVISHRINAMSQISGGTSTELFGKAFQAAVNDPQVSAIVLNVDSGGGSVAGVPELAQMIYDARGSKPIVAVANAEMGSAAYWISSAADTIYATPSAQVGSIGVLTVHTDTSAMEAKKGIQRTIIKSSAYKAEGNPYEPLSADAKKSISEKVAAIHNQFVNAVAMHRGVSASKVETEFGQGRMLLSDKALAVGLIDQVATLDQVLAQFGANPSSALQAHAAGEPAAVVSSPAVSLPAAGGVTLPRKESGMPPKVLTALIRAGLCGADISAEHAQVILTGFFSARGLAVPTDENEIVKALQGAAAPVASVLPVAQPTATPAAVATPSVPGSAPLPVPAPAAGLPVADIVAAVALAPLDAAGRLALQSELIQQAGNLTTSSLLARINQAASVANPPAGPTVSVVVEGRDRFTAAARDSILQRTFAGDLPNEIFNYRTRATEPWKPTARGQGLTLLRIAEGCLAQAGIPQYVLDSLSPYELAQAVMGKPIAQLGISAGDPAYNVSGMFSNILLDAQNVILRRSYTEVNTTFQVWAKRGEDVRDFKTVNKVIAGELPDPKVIPEDGEFEETTLSDGKETYKLSVWGERFSITWQAIVNDQMRAFTEIPVKQGRAMMRKQNKLCYGVLNDNANLADGVALFHASHSNLTTGVNPPSVANFNTMYQKMATQTGISSQAMLNIEPGFVLAPPALRGTVLQVLGSTADPASSNSGVKNIWENGLTPVFDAQLSASATNGSDTAYYFAANPNDVDTVEYAYLQGLTAPQLDSESCFERLAIAYRIYLAFAVKAIDYRGLQKQAGV